MKEKICIILFSFFITINYAQDCKGFEEGVFELKGVFGTIITERKGGWQLEKSVEYEAIYLNRTMEISECKYETRYYKVINQGVLPSPDMSVYATTEIVDVVDNEYYFKSVFSNTERVMEGEYIKISDEVSNEFKELITKESKLSD